MRRLFAILATAYFFWSLADAMAQNPNDIRERNMSAEEAKDILGEKVANEIGERKIGDNFITQEIRDKIKEDRTTIEAAMRNAGTDENKEPEQKRLYILISSSMPDDIIRRYIMSTENIRKNTVFAIKGFVGGMKQFKPTFNWVNKILCGNSPPGSSDCLGASIDINPMVFNEFNVAKVPTFIYLPKGSSPCNCDLADKDNEDKPVYLSHGDASINYHLAKMSENDGPHREEIQKFSQQLLKRYHKNK